MNDLSLPDDAFDRGTPDAQIGIGVPIDAPRHRRSLGVDAIRDIRVATVLTDPTLPGDPIVFANQAFLDLSGYALEDVIGQPPHLLNGPDTDPDDIARLLETHADDPDGSVETVQYRKDGARFVATVLLSAVRNDAGKTTSHCLTWIDVTRRVAAEQDAAGVRSAQAALRESEARSRLLIGSWAQAVWETDAEGVVVADSPTWRAYTGQTLEEWLGYGWLDAIHPDDRVYAERQWREAMAAGGNVDAEFRLRAPDGGWRWTNVRAAPVLNDDGSVEKWAGMNIDIEARKKAEQVLRESEERQAFLLRLSDALRPLSDDTEIERVAVTLLGRHLDVSRVFYATIDPGEASWSIAHDYSESLPSNAGRYSLTGFQRARLAQWRAGRTSSIADSATDPSLNADERAAYAAFGARAAIGVPLVKNGAFAALLVVNSAGPRDWTPAEITLTRETAERTWIAMERSRAEAAMRESEERLRLAEDIGALASWDWDVATGRLTWNARHFALLGYAVDEIAPSYEAWLDRVHQDDRAATETAIERAREERMTYVHAFRTVHADGSIRWCSARGRFFYDDSGTAQRMIGVMEDVTDRVRAERALRVREADLMRVQRIGRVGGLDIDLENMTSVRSPEYLRLHGLTPESRMETHAQWRDRVHPADREAAERHLFAMLDGDGDTYEGEYRIVRPSDGAIRWISARADIERDADGRATRLVGAHLDVTEQKDMQEQQQLLVAELQHRVRNILTVVRSVFGRTIEAGGDIESIGDHFKGRLDALARTQVVVTQSATGTVDLENLILDELLSVGAAGSPLVTVDGPAVLLPPKTAESIGLAIHELTTNALKYGALRKPGGRLRIAWSTNVVKGEDARLVITWAEQGVPAIALQPARRGFGSELIEQALPYRLGAETRLEFRGGGVCCTISVPLSESAGTAAIA